MRLKWNPIEHLLHITRNFIPALCFFEAGPHYFSKDAVEKDMVSSFTAPTQTIIFGAFPLLFFSGSPLFVVCLE
jgi:hypothetical protein